MAFGSRLANRFLEMARACSGHLRSGAGAAAAGLLERGSVRRVFPESGSRGVQWRPIVQAAVPPDRISMPIGVKLFDRISWTKGDNVGRDLLSSSPPLPPVRSEEKERGNVEKGMGVDVMRDALMASQMDLVKSRLREIPRSSVSSSEFLRICSEVSGVEQGPELARLLDESGAVIALGNVVFLRPDQDLRT